MSYAIDLSTHGKQLKSLYDSIVANEELSWAVFGYAGNSLKPVATGTGDLDEFREEFDDGKVQYGFVRILYNDLVKFVLVGWVGEGVPEQQKGYFNAHFSAVAKLFPAYHVQITARTPDDFTIPLILKKIGDAKSSTKKALPTKPKYESAASGVDDSEWGDTPQPAAKVSSVSSSYKPTKVEVSKSVPEKPAALQSSYQPIGKVNIAELRAQAKGSQFANDKPAPLQSSYKPVGKVDIKALRAEAAAAKKPDSYSSSPISSESATTDKTSYKATYSKPAANQASTEYKSSAVGDDDDGDDAAPKSLKERMSVFSGGRLSELPKPKVENKVSARFNPSQAGRGTAPSLPSDGISKSSNVISQFSNYGNEGGKTPAQLWAEKNAKKTGSISSTQGSGQPSATNSSIDTEPEPPMASARAVFSGSGIAEPASELEKETPQKESLGQIESSIDRDSEPSISDVRARFSGASISEHEPEVPAESDHVSTNFAAITSKFAAAKKSETAEGGRGQEAATEEEEEAEIQIPRAVPATPHTEDSTPAPLPPRPANEEPTPAPLPPRAAVEESVPAPLPPRPAADESESAGKSAVAEYEYVKDDDNEIGFAEGELITDIDFVDEDWWMGTNASGERGLFPAPYVTLSTDQAAAGSAESQSASTTSKPSALADFDYEAEESNELSFPEGALITDIEFVDEDWWSGVYNGQRNLFPATYVTLQ